MNKRGISNIISAVIIVLFSISLVLILYVFTKNMLNEQSTDIEAKTQAITNIDLKVLEAHFTENNLYILVQNSGQQDITSFIVRIISSKNEIYLNNSLYLANKEKLGPLNSRDLIIIPAPFGNQIGDYKLIEVYPKFEFNGREEIAENAKSILEGNKITHLAEGSSVNIPVTYSIPEDKKSMINTLWNNRKDFFLSEVNSKLGAGDPYVLYSLETYTINILYYASKLDKKILNQLSELYLAPKQYLVNNNGHMEWICSSSACAGWAQYPSIRNKEVPLVSLQFFYPLAYSINSILDIPQEQRTSNMNLLVSSYTPIITDNLKKWIQNSYMSSLTYLDSHPSSQYPDTTYSDHLTWAVADTIQILKANKKDPVLVPIDDSTRQYLTDFVILGTKVAEEQITRKDLTNFNNQPVKGLNFDLGSYDYLSDNNYSGYTGADNPKTINLEPIRALNTGWDISHARRFVPFFDSMYLNKDITTSSFPSKQDMIDLTNQLAYGSFNKDFSFPLFSNYMDGTNGWYRVGYSTSTSGYPPSGMSTSVLESYGIWSKYNPDISIISASLWDLIFTEYAKNMADSSGNNLNGANIDAKTVSGKSGNALSFDGSKSYVSLGTPLGTQLSMHGKSELTISAWIYNNNINNYSPVVDDFYNTEGDRTFRLWAGYSGGNSGKAQFLVISTSGQQAVYSSTLNNKTWYHITGVKDSTSIKLYINGILNSTASSAGAIESNTGSRNPNAIMRIGYSINNNAYFNGTIDEVKIYNRALSASEVHQNYDNSPVQNGLIAHWKFDEADASQNSLVESKIAHLNKYYGGKSAYNPQDSLELIQFVPSLITETS